MRLIRTLGGCIRSAMNFACFVVQISSTTTSSHSDEGNLYSNTTRLEVLGEISGEHLIFYWS